MPAKSEAQMCHIDKNATAKKWRETPQSVAKRGKSGAKRNTFWLASGLQKRFADDERPTKTATYNLEVRDERTR